MEEDLKKQKSYLSFRLGEEIFAANVSKVLNILEMTKITKVPKAPAHMKGVINLRGTVLPVIDTRVKLGLSPTDVTVNTCILVLEVDVEGEMLQVGALVDAVSEVLEIESDELLPPPSIGNRFKSDFVNGVYKLNDENFIMIIDLDKLFSVNETQTLNEISK